MISRSKSSSVKKFLTKEKLEFYLVKSDMTYKTLGLMMGVNAEFIKRLVKEKNINLELERAKYKNEKLRVSAN